MNTTVKEAAELIRRTSLKVQIRVIEKIVATELKEEISRMPVGTLADAPDIIGELQKLMPFRKVHTRVYGERYKVIGAQRISVSLRDIRLDNVVIREIQPTMNPEDIHKVLAYAVDWLKENGRTVKRKAEGLYQEAKILVAREDKLEKLQLTVCKQLVEHLLPENTPVTVEKPVDNESKVFIGEYLNKYQRIYKRDVKLYYVELNLEQLIREQTVGPVGECTASLLKLYDTWVKESRSKVSNTIIFKGKPIEIKNYKPTKLEIQLANGEADQLSMNEPEDDDSVDAVCLDADKDVICEKIKEWEINGKI